MPTARTAWESLANIRVGLSHVLTHPLNRGRRLRTLARIAGWKLAGPMLRGPVIAPFVDDTRLVTYPGRTSATASMFCGLVDLESMGLVLHVLRPGDTFVDVGANVGVFTILSAGVCGAQTIAVEPIPSSFEIMLDNIQLNACADRVAAHCTALSESGGTLRMAGNLDSSSRVVFAGESGEDFAEVPATTLDALTRECTPLMIKIDVEGFETPVVAGAQRVLANPGVRVVIVETRGLGARYGFDEKALIHQLIDLGFKTCRYDALTRSLESPALRGAENAILVRDIAAVRDRIATAPRHHVHGATI